MPELEDIDSPLIAQQEDGSYSITFYYQSLDNESYQSIILVSGDLHEWMIDSNGEARTFTKEDSIEKPGLYSLTLNGITKGALFATYQFKIENTTPPQIVQDRFNKKALKISKLSSASSDEIVEQTISYVTIPEDAKLPTWADIEPSAKIDGTVICEKYGEELERGTVRQQRDVFIYKPQGFDALPKSDKKLIFMLDGKDMCERLVPSIDKTSELSTSAVIFINPGAYNSNDYPSRVLEYYIPPYNKEFIDLLSDELLPHYIQKLGVCTRNVILDAHSLAAFPMIAVAKKIPGQVGGLILVSPALNQNRDLMLGEEDSSGLKKIPISMHIGKLEGAMPSSELSETRELKQQSRLDANKECYDNLKSCGYKVPSILDTHISGHDAMHVVSSTVQGMSFIQSCWIEADKEQVARFKKTKGELDEIIKNRKSAHSELDSANATEGNVADCRLGLGQTKTING